MKKNPPDVEKKWYKRHLERKSRFCFIITFCSDFTEVSGLHSPYTKHVWRLLRRSAPLLSKIPFPRLACKVCLGASVVAFLLSKIKNLCNLLRVCSCARYTGGWRGELQQNLSSYSSWTYFKLLDYLCGSIHGGEQNHIIEWMVNLGQIATLDLCGGGNLPALG